MGLAICLLVFILSNCVKDASKNSDPRGPGYIGSAKCASCHKNVFESYATTAHYLSSRQPSHNAIKGSFFPGANTYFYRPALKVVMESRDSGFYQVAYIDGMEKQGRRFDMVFGSGTKGQSYAYWLNEYVFQLPVSYFTPGKTWANSPNFPPHHVKFDRNIPIGCFECHSSYIKKTFVEVAEDRLIDHLDKSRIVYGIDCERCHGPAADHTYFHEKNPLDKKARYITLYASLTRDQQQDMCAICHSGPTRNVQSTFNFVPGNKLSDFVLPDSTLIDTTGIDVHGKQVQLLAKSACFKKSNLMNCSTCHNPHVTEREEPALFSQRCMNCHQPTSQKFCKMAPALGDNIVKNCIDCHMPVKPSKLITLASEGQKAPIPALVRTHFISVYPEESKQFITGKK